MKIKVNDQEIQVLDQATLAELMIQVDAKSPFAIALNGQFIARHDYSRHALNEGDCVDIVHPVSGG